jgi:hypothetical protein
MSKGLSLATRPTKADPACHHFGCERKVIYIADISCREAGMRALVNIDEK